MHDMLCGYLDAFDLLDLVLNVYKACIPQKVSIFSHEARKAYESRLQDVDDEVCISIYITERDRIQHFYFLIRVSLMFIIYRLLDIDFVAEKFMK